MVGSWEWEICGGLNEKGQKRLRRLARGMSAFLSNHPTSGQSGLSNLADFILAKSSQIAHKEQPGAHGLLQYGSWAPDCLAHGALHAPNPTFHWTSCARQALVLPLNRGPGEWPPP